MEACLLCTYVRFGSGFGIEPQVRRCCSLFTPNLVPSTHLFTDISFEIDDKENHIFFARGNSPHSVEVELAPRKTKIMAICSNSSSTSTLYNVSTLPIGLAFILHSGYLGVGVEFLCAKHNSI